MNTGFQGVEPTLKDCVILAAETANLQCPHRPLIPSGRSDRKGMSDSFLDIHFNLLGKRHAYIYTMGSRKISYISRFCVIISPDVKHHYETQLWNTA